MAENGSTIEMELNVTPKESSLQETTKKTADSLSKASKVGAKAYSNAMKSATKEFVSYLQEEMGKASTKIRKGGLSERGIINQVIGDLSSGKLKLDKASSYIKNFGKETNKVLDEQKKKVTILDAVWSEMTKNIGKRVSIFASYKAIGAMTGLLESSLSSIIQLEKEFANIQAITASTEGTMASLSKTIFEVGSNSMYTNEELAKATVTLGQAGYSAQEIEKLLESVSQLAAATGTDLTTSVQVATSALTVWNLEASQMTRVADVLTTAVNATKAEIGTIANGIQYAGAMFAELGVSLEESVALFSAVTNAGLKARSVVGTGARALVTELITPTEKLKKVMGDLGLTMDDIDVRSKGITLVLQKLKDAGFGAEEAFAAMDRRAATFYSAASSQLSTMKDLSYQFQVSGSTAKAAATQMDTLSAQMSRFKNVVVETTSVALRPLIDGLTLLMKAINALLSIPLLKEGVAFLAVGKMLSSAFSIGKTAVKSFSSGLSKISDVVKTATASVSGLSKAVGGLKALFLAFKGPLIVGGILALVEILRTVYNKFFSIEEAIARLESKTNTYNSSMDSLNSVYTDLINKQDLYKDDSEALAFKIAELNNQIGIENGLLLDQVKTWEELLNKLNEYRFLKEKEQVQTTRDLIGQQEKVALGKLPISRLSKGWGTSPTGPISEKMITADGRKEIERLVKMSDDEFADHYLEMSKIVNKEQREAEKEFLNEVHKLRTLTKKSKAEATSSTIGGAISQLVKGWRDEITDIEKHYKDASKEMLKEGNAFDPEEAVNLIKDTNEKMKVLRDNIKAKKEYLLKTFPQLEGQNVEVNKILSEIEGEMTTKLLNLTKEFDEEVVKFIDEEFKLAEKRLNNVIKMAKTKQLSGTEGEILLKNALSNYEYLSILKQGVELNKATKSNSMDATRTASIDEKYSSDRARFTAEVAAGLDLITDRATKATEKINELKKSITRLNVEASDEKSKLKESLGINKQSALLSVLNERGASPSRIRDEQIRLEKMQFEYEEKALAVDEKLLENLKKKEITASTNLQTSKDALSVASKELDDLKNLSEKQAEFNQKKDEVKRLTEEVNSYEGIQLDLAKQILEKEEAITQEKYKQGFRNEGGNVGPDGKPKTPTETKEYKGMQGGRDKYFNEGVEAFQEFGPVAQTTYQAISQLETGFADLFKNIADGSMSAGDAFKAMISTFLQSMADFIVSLAAKAAVLAALSAIPGMPALLASMDNLAWLSTANNAVKVGQTANAANAAANASGKASGGPVVGGVPNRDSVPTRLMPGEFVMKKSAVSALGEDFLTNLNNNTAATMNAMKGSTVVQNNEPSVVNVWVVADKEQAQMGPNDIIATISKDIRTGGTTKKLIQSVVAGRKA